MWSRYPPAFPMKLTIPGNHPDRTKTVHPAEVEARGKSPARKGVTIKLLITLAATERVHRLTCG